MANGTSEAADWIPQSGCGPVPPSPVDANHLCLFKACEGETAARHLDEAQITSLECAVDKPTETLNAEINVSDNVDESQEVNQLKNYARYNSIFSANDIANMTDSEYKAFNLNLKFAIFAEILELKNLQKE